MKKFQGLGKNLSKLEQKNIMGGLGGGTFCSDGTACTYRESGTGMVTGKCEQNSNNACVCKSANSSVLWSECQNG
jgi:hypothetical protein